MKDLLITDDCFVKGEPRVAGEVIKDVDNSTAAQLLTSGRAVIAPEEKKVAKKEAVKKEAVKKAAKKAAKKAVKEDESSDS